MWPMLHTHAHTLIHTHAHTHRYIFTRVQALNAAYAAHDDLWTGFLSPEHFGAMASLLGYGGVAVCFDEMLKLVHHEVCVCLYVCMCVGVYMCVCVCVCVYVCV